MISLSLANDLYSWGWKASMIGAVITAVGVGALFLGTRVRDHNFETQMVSLNREAAKARERAATAELQTEQIKQRIAPRFMKRDVFLKALEGQPKAKVEILYLRDDPECMEVAQNIAQLLQEAGWDVVSREPLRLKEDVPGAQSIPSMMTVGGQPSGITIIARSATEEEFNAFPNKMMRKPWVKTPFTVLQDAISEGIGRVNASAAGPNPPADGTLRVTVAPKGTSG